MCDICAKEDDRLIENFWSDAWHQDTVDPSELDIDLETEVGECLRRCFVHILGLDTLSCHSQDCIANSLDLSIDRGLARQHHHNELQSRKVGLQVAEHRLNLIGP